MQVRVSGANIDVGQALTEYSTEHLAKEVTKYFEKAVSSEVHFSKQNSHLFRCLIIVNEGVKGGIMVKSDAEAGEVHACFNEALQKISKQLRRYKRRIKNYRRAGGGIKAAEPIYESYEVKKYVIPPLPHDVFAEVEEEISHDDSVKIINEKNTAIETLTVNEAVMKMDLADLPTLVFVNKDNGRVNVVYHRKDGNISWIDAGK